MKTRVLSGVMIGVILFLVLSSGGYALAAVLCTVSFIAYYELCGAFHVVPEGRRVNSLVAAGFAGILLHYGLLVFFDRKMVAFGGSVLFVFFAASLLYVLRFPHYRDAQMKNAVFAFLYAPVLLSFLYLIRLLPAGAVLVWVPFDAWICDTFAYLTGRLFGKHKLCPQLSPKKTVEGAVGGAACAMIAGMIFGAVFHDNALSVLPGALAYAVIGLAIGIFSQWGDLLASAFKRDTDIKDYGNLIPGHGGIMDRFDSVIFVTPVVYLLSVMLLYT